MGYELPTEIVINETPFKIRNQGDFRMVFDCFSALNDIELTKFERIAACLIIFYEDFSDIDDIPTEIMESLVKEMFGFFNCGDDLKSNTSNVPVIDWDTDSNLICSAINNVANKEIRAEKYLHWWTFMGYYMSIGECPLSTIVGIRYKKARGSKLEKYELQYMRDNPQYFRLDTRSTEQKEMDAQMRNMWNTN